MKKHPILFKHLLYFSGIFLIFLFWKCPPLYLFGIPCPGCGLTRAHLAALQLDFSKAFYYHPLFFIAIPTILYVIHKRVLPKRFPVKVETILCILLLTLTFGVYFYRLFISKSPVVQIHLDKGVLSHLFLTYNLPIILG